MLLPGKLTNVPWKSMVGRCISYWNSPFLGDEFVRFRWKCLLQRSPSSSSFWGKFWTVKHIRSKSSLREGTPRTIVFFSISPPVIPIYLRPFLGVIMCICFNIYIYIITPFITRPMVHLVAKLFFGTTFWSPKGKGSTGLIQIFCEVCSMDSMDFQETSDAAEAHESWRNCVSEKSTDTHEPKSNWKKNTNTPTRYIIWTFQDVNQMFESPNPQQTNMKIFGYIQLCFSSSCLRNVPPFFFQSGYLACVATTINIWLWWVLSVLTSRTKTGRDVSLLAKLSLFYLSLGWKRQRGFWWEPGGGLPHPWKIIFHPAPCLWEYSP